MGKQPNALRLASRLDHDQDAGHLFEIVRINMAESAAELRRLHASEARLLEALISYVCLDANRGATSTELFRKASAAISAARGEQ